MAKEKQGYINYYRTVTGFQSHSLLHFDQSEDVLRPAEANLREVLFELEQMALELENKEFDRQEDSVRAMCQSDGIRFAISYLCGQLAKRKLLGLCVGGLRL